VSTPDAFVFVDLDGAPHLAGRLWVHATGASQRATFEYDAGWIHGRHMFPLEPALTVGPGPHHTAGGRALFGAIGDSAPDRWGRTLLARRERLAAETAGRTPRTLLEIDYLLGTSDFTRQGALRFKKDVDGPFVASGGEHVPPFVEIGRLLSAAERASEDAEDMDDLQLLLAPGSSLLGSRPKASVLGRRGELLIAKFNRPDDDYDVGLWEGVAMALARHAGIHVASSSLEKVDGRTVITLERFDRAGHSRIPFLSAMSMLGANDGAGGSYLEIADAIRRSSPSATADLRELWRRLVYTVLISNTDDHLRNHGFLYTGNQGWTLSPAYDLNPVPTDIRPRILSTAILDGDDRSAAMSLAYEAAAHFGIRKSDARESARSIAHTVSRWRAVALELGATKRACDRMASAFEHTDLAETK
jgi:serine/threonine-protein kinase HipA